MHNLLLPPAWLAPSCQPVCVWLFNGAEHLIMWIPLMIYWTVSRLFFFFPSNEIVAVPCGSELPGIDFGLNEWAGQELASHSPGPDPPCLCFCMAQEPRMRLHFYMMKKKNQKIIISRYIKKSHKIESSMSTRKVLLQHSHTFVDLLSRATFLLRQPSWVAWQGPYGPPETLTIWPITENICWPLTKGKLRTSPCLNFLVCEMEITPAL